MSTIERHSSRHEPNPRFQRMLVAVDGSEGSDYAAGEKIDLIVMRTRGMGGFKKMLLGSVSSSVVTHAQCAVLVVR